MQVAVEAVVTVDVVASVSLVAVTVVAVRCQRAGVTAQSTQAAVVEALADWLAVVDREDLV